MRMILLALLISGCFAAPTCQENEEFTTCGTACEPSCKDPAPSICTENCLVNVCQCQQGYVRHQGKCIFEFFCPKTCPENEEAKICGTACEPSCEVPEPSFCTKQCLVNVCQCKNGYVRKEGKCILREECPKKV